MIKTHSAGGIVLSLEGKILLVNQNGNSWSLPKGHVENNETLLSAAKREIYEESGITHLELLDDLGCYRRYRIGLNGEDDRSELKTINMFLFKTNQLKLNPYDQNNPQALWITANQVLEYLTHPKDCEFFIKNYNKYVKMYNIS